MIISIILQVTGTYPDLTFLPSFLSQFSFKPNKQYIVDIRHCLRYIKGTRDLTIIVSYNDMN
jgi:hypothetical protein